MTHRVPGWSPTPLSPSTAGGKTLGWCDTVARTPLERADARHEVVPCSPAVRAGGLVPRGTRLSKEALGFLGLGPGPDSGLPMQRTCSPGPHNLGASENPSSNLSVMGLPRGAVAPDATLVLRSPPAAARAPICKRHRNHANISVRGGESTIPFIPAGAPQFERPIGRFPSPRGV